MGGRRGSSTVLAGTARRGSAGAESGTATWVEIASTEIAAAWRQPQLHTPLLQQARWPLAGDEPRSASLVPKCPLQCSIPGMEECDRCSMSAMWALNIGALTTFSAIASSEKKSVTLRPGIQVPSTIGAACSAARPRSSSALLFTNPACARALSSGRFQTAGS